MTQAPTRDAADSVIRAFVNGWASRVDANDVIYAFDASRNYDPSSHMAEITTPTLAINTADDEVNPPELHIVEPLVAQAANVRFILIPTSSATHGHGTHTRPAVWGHYLEEFLSALPER